MANKTYSEVIEKLAQFARQGVQIVPFIGAGLSAGSGFPITSEFRSYFCKTNFFITHGVFRRLLGQSVDHPDGKEALSLEQNPSSYLQQYGWPDYNRLTADLWNYAASNPITSEKRKQDAIKQLKQRLKDLQKAKPVDRAKVQDTEKDMRRIQAELRDSLRETLFGKYPVTDDAMEKLVEGWYVNRAVRALADFRAHPNDSDEKSRFEEFLQSVEKGKWGTGRERIQSIVNNVLLDTLRTEDERMVRDLEPKVWSGKLSPRVDWFRLLLDVVEGELGLIDSLFAMLSRQRSPSIGHMALALLSRELHWPLLLTLNHDKLLEQAFQNEKIELSVYDVNRSCGVPSSFTVSSEPLSLIKLHGSSYGLRVGEPTMYALDEETKTQILSYIPKNAVLLVVGFSGAERRMMSLIESCAKDHEIYWARREPVAKLSSQVRRLIDRTSAEKIHDFQVRSASSFLLGLMTRVTDCLPLSNTSYRALPKRVFTSSQQTTATPLKPKKHIQVFLPTKTEGGKEQEALASPDRPFWKLADRSALQYYSSTELSNFVHAQSDYQTIWIDLEEHHTVAGVINDIIEQMRVHDPQLPSLYLPVLDSSATNRKDYLSRAVRFIGRALRRGRYALAFDSLESFSRPHTLHHGQPNESGGPECVDAIEAYLKNKLDPLTLEPGPYRSLVELLFFLESILVPNASDDVELDMASEADWYCGIAIDHPLPRHFRKLDKLKPDEQKADKQQPPQFHEWVREVLKAFIGKLKSKGVAEFRGPEIGEDVAESRRPEACQENGGQPTESNDNLAKLTAKIAKSTRDDLATHMYGGSTNDAVQQPINNTLLAIDWSPGTWLFVLSAFRRPRSRAAVIWLASELASYLHPKQRQTREQRDSHLQALVDDHLRALVDNHFIIRAEGELYWIPNTLHYALYTMLAGPLWDGGMLEIAKQLDALSKNDAKGAVESLGTYTLRGAWLMQVHSTIGRYYYIHAWERTGDPSALYEYIYHRVASINSVLLVFQLLTVAKAVLANLHSPFTADQWKTIQSAWNAIQSALGAPVIKFDDVPKAVEVVDNLIQATQHHCAEYLRVLLNVFRTERHTILSSAPSETWLGWCDRLSGLLKPFASGGGSSRDMRKFAGTKVAQSPAGLQSGLTGHSAITPEPIEVTVQLGVEGGEKSPEHNGGDQTQTSAAEQSVYTSYFAEANDAMAKLMINPNDEFSMLVKNLRLELIDLKGELLHHAGEYQKCLESRAEMATILLDVPADDAKGMSDTLTTLLGVRPKGCGAQVVKTMIQILTNLLGSAKSVQKSLDSRVIDQLRDWCRDVLICIRRVFPECKEFQDNAIELWKACGKAMDRDTKRQFEQAQARIEFEILRLEVDELCNPEKNRLRDATGGLLDSEDEKSIRGRADDLNDRVESGRRWLYANPPRSEQEHLIGLAEYSTLKARILSKLDDHEHALHVLADAENGVSENDLSSLFLVALTKRIRAEIRINYADFQFAELYDQEKKTGTRNKDDRSGAADRAEVQLRLARVDLSDCERVLRNTRRHLSAWTRLHDVQAQLAVEELLLIAHRVDHGHVWTDRTTFESSLHTVLLRGLEAIRRGIDGIPLTGSGGQASEAVPTRCRFNSLWLELLLLGYGSVAAKISSPKNTDGDGQCVRHLERLSPNQFRPRWEALNESAGLSIERMFKALPDFRDLVDRAHGEIADHCDLPFRRNLIQMMDDAINLVYPKSTAGSAPPLVPATAAVNP